jgi:hypothetical protein
MCDFHSRAFVAGGFTVLLTIYADVGDRIRTGWFTLSLAALIDRPRLTRREDGQAHTRRLEFVAVGGDASATAGVWARGVAIVQPRFEATDTH